MTAAINMELVSIKPSLFDGDPSLAFYNAAADISVFICVTPSMTSLDGKYYKMSVVGKLAGLSTASVGDYAEAAWAELMPVGVTTIQVTEHLELLDGGVQSRLCIAHIEPTEIH